MSTGALASGAVFGHRLDRRLGVVGDQAARPSRSRRLNTIASYLAIAVVALIGMLFLRPMPLGGPAGYVMVRGVSMLPTYHTGDLVITQPRASYAKGDIVAYRVPKGEIGAGIIVIHRIIGGSASTGFVIQGDNNSFTDDWHPKPSDMVGRAWIHVPRLGLLLAFLHAPVPMASLAAGVVVAMVMVPPKEKTNKARRVVVDKTPIDVKRDTVPVAQVRWRTSFSVLVVAAAAIALGMTSSVASGAQAAARPPGHGIAAAAHADEQSCLASDRPSTEAEIVNLESTCPNGR